MFLGSCFAENMGSRMAENQFPCVVNPTGVLYNPLSIFQVLGQFQARKFDAECFLFRDGEGRWGSWLHSTLFSAATREECLGQITASFDTALHLYEQMDVLVLTFGTNHYYRLKERPLIVSNCHKQPAALFEEHEASVADMLECSHLLLSELFRQNQHLRVILTVSPYRYLKYGAHGNRLAKAALMLYAHELEKSYPDKITYFPAYEILEDELRDYRFYADDMVHPSSLAVQYIWERFTQCYFTPSALAQVARMRPILKAQAHRTHSKS